MFNYLVLIIRYWYLKNDILTWQFDIYQPKLTFNFVSLIMVFSIDNLTFVLFEAYITYWLFNNWLMVINCFYWPFDIGKLILISAIDDMIQIPGIDPLELIFDINCFKIGIWHLQNMILIYSIDNVLILRL